MGLKYDPRAQASIRGYAPGPKKSLKAALRLIREDPLHAELDWKVLASADSDRLMRARVGDYRIVYLVRSDHTYILRIMHRREGYGWLERA